MAYLMIDLWLDDERNPKDPRIQELFNAEPGMVWVKTAEAAISYLKRKQVRSISLDHDLGTKATGYDVALWIEQQAFQGNLPQLLWAVHSANVVGARAIRKAMEKAEAYWRATHSASLSTSEETPSSSLEGPATHSE